MSSILDMASSFPLEHCRNSASGLLSEAQEDSADAKVVMHQGSNGHGRLSRLVEMFIRQMSKRARSRRKINLFSMGYFSYFIPKCQSSISFWAEHTFSLRTAIEMRLWPITKVRPKTIGVTGYGHYLIPLRKLVFDYDPLGPTQEGMRFVFFTRPNWPY